jgi:hypothetical protein
MDDDWQNLAPNSLGELAPVTAATLWKTHHDPICWACTKPLTTPSERALNTHQTCSITEPDWSTE